MWTLIVINEITGPITKVWRETPLRGYQHDVPRFALGTAQEVKMRCPQAEIMVEELIKDKALKDPFLVTKLGKEKFYLEVWDEPGYEQERMV